MTEPAIGTSTGRRYGGASADERRAARYRQLIRAAITVYGDRGYRGATVSMICKEAGLTPRYFYEAFANGEALLAATFREVTDVMMARIAQAGAAARGTPADAMRAILATYYDMLRAEPATARVFLLEITGISPPIDALFWAAFGQFGEMVASTLASPGSTTAAADPLLRDGAIYGLLHLARSWVAGGYRQRIDEVVAAALPLCFLAGGGMAAPPAA